MNRTTKHLALAIFGLVLVLATLFVRGEANSHEEMKSVGFGYPFPYVFQDFSRQDRQYSFFPSYPQLDLGGTYPIVGFSAPNFLLSWLAVFVVLEIVICIVELIDAWVRRKFSRVVEDAAGVSPE